MKYKRTPREKRGQAPRRDPWRDFESRVLIEAGQKAAAEARELARLKRLFLVDHGIEA